MHLTFLSLQEWPLVILSVLVLNLSSYVFSHISSLSPVAFSPGFSSPSNPFFYFLPLHSFPSPHLPSLPILSPPLPSLSSPPQRCEIWDMWPSCGFCSNSAMHKILTFTLWCICIIVYRLLRRGSLSHHCQARIIILLHKNTCVLEKRSRCSCSGVTNHTRGKDSCLWLEKFVIFSHLLAIFKWYSYLRMPVGSCVWSV